MRISGHHHRSPGPQAPVVTLAQPSRGQAVTSMTRPLQHQPAHNAPTSNDHSPAPPAADLAGALEPGARLAWLRKIRKDYGTRVVRAFITVLASMTVLVLALLLIGSLIGEFIAILALYHRQSSPGQALYVLISVIILAAVIALVTFGRLPATFFRLLSMTMRDRRDRKRAIEIALKTDAGQPLTVADYLWVPKTYATRRYSWITPPTRSRRRTRMWSRSVTSSGSGRSGAAWFRVRCGRCVL